MEQVVTQEAGIRHLEHGQIPMKSGWHPYFISDKFAGGTGVPLVM